MVEGQVRSGALSTARHAANLLRPVMGVPGPVTSSLSAGPHKLVREYAGVLVTSVADVLEVVGPLCPRVEAQTETVRAPTDGLAPAARRLVAALPTRSAWSPTRLAAEAGVPLAEVRSLLPVLELDGLSARLDGGWRRGPALKGAG